MTEDGVRWSRPFVLVFALATAGWLLAIPYVSPRVWLGGALGTFFALEAAGLWRRRDGLPPLTYIAARYVPRWATVTLVGFFTGLAAATWMGYASPLKPAALLALYSWAQDHFDQTYEQRS